MSEQRTSHTTNALRMRLLCCSALVGLSVGLADSASAGQTWDIAKVRGAKEGNNCVNARSTCTINTKRSHSIIKWNSFDVLSGDTLNFQFGKARDSGKNWIALNIVNKGSANVKGQINGFLRNGNYGGNIWIYAPEGVVIHKGGTINVGGFLATTSRPSDFQAGNSSQSVFNFGASENSGTVDIDGTINSYGGTVAFVAPIITVEGSASVTSASGKRTDVLYGAAKAFKIQFPDDGSNMDLVSFTVPANGGIGKSGDIDIQKRSKTTVNGNVYVAAVAKSTVTDAMIDVEDGAKVASTGSDGTVVLSGGNDISVSPPDATTGPRTVTLTPNSQNTGKVNVAVDGTVSTQGKKGVVNVNTTGSVTEAATGSIETAMLTGQSVGGASFAGDNAIRSLGSFTNTGSGDLALTDSGPLTVSGPVTNTVGNTSLTTTNGGIRINNTVDSSGHTLTLQSGGGIGEGANGSIKAAVLKGSWNNNSAVAAGNVNLNATNSDGSSRNSIGELDGFANNGTKGNFSLVDDALNVVGPLTDTAGNISLTTTAGDLHVSGTIDATGHELTLNSAGNIDESAGAITAGTLAGHSAGGANFASANNLIDTLGRFTNDASGDFQLKDNERLTVAGPLTNRAGGITLETTNGDVIFTGDTTAHGAIGVSADQGGISQNSGSIASKSGDVSLAANGGSIRIDGTIDSSGHTLTLQSGGGIGEGANGSIEAAVLKGSWNNNSAVAAGNVNINATNSDGSSRNSVRELDGFTNNGSNGNFSLVDGRTLDVVGPLTDQVGNISLTTAAGDLHVSGTIDATGHELTLNSAGRVDESAGAITAGTLAGHSSGGANFASANNLIDTLGRFTNDTSGDFQLKDNETLTVAGSVTNRAGGITLETTSGDVIFTGDTNAHDAINVTADTGGITQKSGSIASKSGDVSLAANGGDFTQTGGEISASEGTLSIQASGDVTQDAGGSFAADLLSVNGTKLTFGGSTTVTGTDPNTAAQPYAAMFKASGDFTQNGGTITVDNGTLSVNAGGNVLQQLAGATGPLPAMNAENISVTAKGTAGITVDGDITASKTLNLTSKNGGDIEVGTDGVLTSSNAAHTGTLTLASGGGIDLDGSLTADQLISMTAAGDIGQDNGSVTSTFGGVTIESKNGDIDFAGNVNANEQIVVAADEGSIAQSAGTITSDDSDATFTAKGNFTQTGGSITATAGDTGITANGGPITIDGTIDSTGHKLTLISGSSIDESAGGILAGTLTGSSHGDATFGSSSNASNRIDALDAFDTNGGDFSLTDGTGLDVTGELDGNNVALNIGGTLNEKTGSDGKTLGFIDATALKGSSVGGTTLNGDNSIGTLHTFTNTSGGGFALTDTRGLNIDGLLTSGGAATVKTTAGGITIDAGAGIDAGSNKLTLDSAGSIDESAGSITAGTLTGSSVGGANFASANNLIGALDGFTNSTSGDFQLKDNETLNVAGPLTNDAGGVSLETTSGDIVFAGDVTAGNNISVTADQGKIAQDSGTIAGATVALTSNGSEGISVDGNLTASNGLELTSNNGGGIEVGDGAVLTSSNTAKTGTLTLASSGGMDLDGVLTADQQVFLTAADGITQNGGSITSSSGDVTLAADGGAFAQNSGSISAANVLDLTADGTTGDIIQAAGGSLSGGTVDLTANGGDMFSDPGTGTKLAISLNGTVYSSGTLNLNAANGSVGIVASDATPAASNPQIQAASLSVTAGGDVLVEADVTGPTAYTQISVAGLTSISAGGDVLMGSTGFINAVQGLAPNKINVDLHQPNESSYAPKLPSQYVFVHSKDLTIGGGGKIVQENVTEQPLQPSGIVLDDSKPDALKIQGAGNKAPDVIDLFVQQASTEAGKFLPFRQVAPITKLEGVPASNDYRVNGCVIGDAGNCDIVQFNFNIPSLQRLSDIVLTAPEEEQEDPTITISGNEEEWLDQ